MALGAWDFLEREFGAVYTDDPGRPPLPTRGSRSSSPATCDEVLCERWVENSYYQYFCGEEFFQNRLVFDRSSLTREGAVPVIHMTATRWPR